MREVDDVAGAAESVNQCLAEDCRQVRRFRVEYLIGRQAIGVITAGVGGGSIQADAVPGFGHDRNAIQLAPAEVSRISPSCAVDATRRPWRS